MPFEVQHMQVSDNNPFMSPLLSCYKPVVEQVLPSYFENPGFGHPSMPADSCNPTGEEHFRGTTQGLDNDGDGSYDTADSDYQVTFTVGGDVSGLAGTALALQDNGVNSLGIAAEGPLTFTTELNDGGAYVVTVSTQPMDQTCNVSNAMARLQAQMLPMLL